jgi:transcriptional regulator with XRE-family HTH domain
MPDLNTVARRLMEQRGVSLRALAKAVHQDPSYLSRVLRGLKPCGPKLARDIDDALTASGDVIQAAALSRPAEGARAGTAEALDVMTWVTATNASNDAITELERSAHYLAEAHARMPAAKVLREVLGVHRAAHALLRGGRQRLAQTRELLRTDSTLLAHACLLLGDLGKYEAARAYGSAALLCAQADAHDRSPFGHRIADEGLLGAGGEVRALEERGARRLGAAHDDQEVDPVRGGWHAVARVDARVGSEMTAIRRPRRDRRRGFVRLMHDEVDLHSCLPFTSRARAGA